MEITSFILGVCVVIVIAMVVGTFVNYMSVKRLKEQLDTLERDIYQQVDLTNQKLDKTEDELMRYSDKLHQHLEDEMNKLYGYVDSRTDKLHAQFSSNIASGEEVKRALDEIKDLNERLDRFIRNYQNI
jgi:methyl-accepting chemotaxis protein